MHQWRNRQEHVLVFAGTGEGPVLAKTLLDAGFRVSVSVVSEAAAKGFAAMALQDLHVGAFPSQQSLADHLATQAVTCVVDATHPFALRISADLQSTCGKGRLRLIRYERPDHDADDHVLLETINDLARVQLSGHRLLLAVGARQLQAAVTAARRAGAVVHARVLPTADAIRKAGAAGLSGDQLAVLRPSTGERPGALEAALCRRWQISDVLCRQSGGAADGLWSRLCADRSMRLWKLKRPGPMLDIDVVHSVNELCRTLNANSAGPQSGAHHGGQ